MNMYLLHVCNLKGKVPGTYVYDLQTFLELCTYPVLACLFPVYSMLLATYLGT